MALTTVQNELMNAASSTGAFSIPVGTTAQRGPSVQGTIRYNTDTSSFEGYSNGNWGAVGGAMYVSANTVSDANNISNGFFSLDIFYNLFWCILLSWFLIRKFCALHIERDQVYVTLLTDRIHIF